MKIIKNNNETNDYNCDEIVFPKEVECEKCKSIVLVEKEDLIIGQLGLKTFKCPCCDNEDNYEEYLGEIVLDKNNLTFPNNYYCFEKGIKLTNKEINKYVKQCIETLEKNKEMEYTTTGTGDCKIFVERYDGDGEYCITVCRNHWESFVPIK